VSRNVLFCVMLAAFLGQGPAFAFRRLRGDPRDRLTAAMPVRRVARVSTRRGDSSSPRATTARLRIWDPAAGTLLRVRRSPSSPRAGSPSTRLRRSSQSSSTDGAGANFLAVWDWEKERELFRVALREESALRSFSGLGRTSFSANPTGRAEDHQLFRTAPPWASIQRDSASWGSPNVALGKTLMTYQVSGRIHVLGPRFREPGLLDVPAVPT